MRESEFAFDSVDLLHYNLHKKSLNRGGSDIDLPKWLINSKNNDEKCFPYTIKLSKY